MLFKIFAIKDKLTERFMQPFYMKNEDEAKRLFATNLKKIDIWGDNPEQFSLWSLGEFSEEKGIIDMTPTEICKGSDLIG